MQVLLRSDYQYLTPWNPSDKQTKAPPIQVVTCFLQKRDKVLLLQRARKDIQHNLWGIPGGKLDKGEEPIPGLVREIKEETGSKLDPQIFQLLGTARSKTQCDGEYGLYLYHASVSNNFSVNINPSEHHAYRWVTFNEFESMELLTAQGEAFKLVKEQLHTLCSINQKQRGVLC
jgi:8-oxo-dGTP pyrophosphatase MutT (NUDIX family)